MISKKILKLVSATLASVMFVNSFGTLTRATSYDKNTEAAIASTKKDTNKSKIGWILGGCGTGAGVIALASYLIYRDITKIPSDYLYNKLSKNQTINATADDWFNRLGGTQQDIDNYKTLKSGYTDTFKSLIPPISSGNDQSKQIALDTNRYPSETIPGAQAQTDEFKEIFTRILVLYYTNHTDVSYTQGWDNVMYMIYYKFMIDRGKDINSPLDQDDEAKVYFIYTKFMKVLAKFNDNSQWTDLAQSYHDKYVSSFGGSIDCVISKCRDIDVQIIIPTQIFPGGLFTLGIQLLRYDESIRIWDRIITDDTFVDQNGDFNADAVLDNLNVIIYQHFKTPADIEKLYLSKSSK